MRWIYTDADGSDAGVLTFAKIEHEESAEVNTVAITVPMSSTGLLPLSPGAKIFVYDDDDRSIGGVITRIDSADTAAQTITYGGYTFRGLMATRQILPYISGKITDGWDLTANGTASEAVERLLDKTDMLRSGTHGFYQVMQGGEGGTSRSRSIERYITLLQAVDRVYEAEGCRAACVFSPADKNIKIGGEAFQAYPKEYDGDSVSLNARKDFRPVTRLVCLGRGEYNDRDVVNLYLQLDGSISETPVTRSTDEQNVRIYNYTGADGTTELREYGKELYKELLSATTGLDLKVERMDLKYGDTVGATERNTGLHIEQKVIRKVISIEVGSDWADAVKSVSYELGDM